MWTLDPGEFHVFKGARVKFPIPGYLVNVNFLPLGNLFLPETGLSNYRHLTSDGVYGNTRTTVPEVLHNLQGRVMVAKIL